MSESVNTDVVIIGGGIIGASIAYHVATQTGLDVLLLERDQLTCGTTWHAAGLVAELRATANLTRLAKYSGQLYETLEFTGFKRVGALTLATTDERREELQRQAAMARNNGVTCHWLTPREVSERWPSITSEDIVGAVYMPNDGQTNPVDTTVALARAAEAAGALVWQQTPVEHIQLGDPWHTITTHSASIRARRVVIAAGLWSRAIAHSVGSFLPLYPAEHFYAVTEPVDQDPDMPIVRDPDHGIYIKPDAGRLLVGCFERDAKPIDPQTLAQDFSFEELPFDLDHFAPYLENACHRIERIGQTGIRTWFNGPESFTPDGRYLLGPMASAHTGKRIPGLYAACGFNSIGIQSAGGVGQVMAQWIAQELPPCDLWGVDTRRFSPRHDEGAFLEARTSESLGLLYAMHWPHRQHESVRNIRCSPLHQILEASGACFGEVNLWERANWFADKPENAYYKYSYGAQNWHAAVAEEFRAVREHVAVFDQSSFGKFLVSGPEAVPFLNRLSTADIDVSVGDIVYSQFLNDRGGIESDVTITRLSNDEFWVIGACPCQQRDYIWLNEHAVGRDVEIVDITDAYAVIGVMGPRARDLLQSLTSDDLAHTAFPFGCSRELRLATINVRASRVTYVGALGWELYVKAEDAMTLWRALTELPNSPKPAGYHAMDSLRIEKGYRHWGHDITDEDSPLQAGLSFTVAWDKPGGFIGRQALLQQRADGLRRRMLSFKLEDPDVHLFHDEPIWRNGEPAGAITSAAFGYGEGASIGLGYITTAEPLTLRQLVSDRYQIEVGDKLINAQAQSKAWFDPRNLTIRR